MIVPLRHGCLDLALHCMRDRQGPALLLLHGLGERTPTEPPGYVEPWPGSIWGLDFTGHGHSTVPIGGGYTAERLLADASIALAHLGSATVLGRGIGAWIALQLAGARPAAVRGAVLADGPGLTGGGTEPASSFVVEIPRQAQPCPSPDPFALAELVRDVRPPDYAAAFVRFALEGAEVADPITVASVARPPWLVAVAAEPGVVQARLGDALAAYSG